MRIKSIHIENFKGFKHKFELEFPQENLCVIIGKNGSGKSTLLAAIERLVNQTVNKIRGNGQIVFIREDISFGQENMNLELLLDQLGKPISIQQFYPSKRGTSINTFNQIIDLHQVLTEIYTKIQKRKFENLPLLAVYSDKLNFNYSGKSELYYPEDNYIMIQRLYENYLIKDIYITEVKNWYVDQINVNNNEKVKKKDLNYNTPNLLAISKGVENFLSKISQTELGEILVDKPEHKSQTTLCVSKNGTIFSFDQLSSCEQNILGLTLDIIFRLCILNPESKNPLSENGIVVIDEIDKHLHPVWQMEILQALSLTFPNIQFIVTTHSPIILYKLEKKQIIYLDNFKQLDLNKFPEIYGKDVNQILEVFMGTSSRFHEVKEKLERIEMLVDDSKLDEAKSTLQELRNTIDPNDLEVVKLDHLINIVDALD